MKGAARKAGFNLKITVRPGGKKDGFDGLLNDMLVFKVSAKAQDGKANEAVRDVVGEKLRNYTHKVTFFSL